MASDEAFGGTGRAPVSRGEGAFGHADRLSMAPCPILPDWVRSGEPRSDAAQHSRALDGLASTNVWQCTRGTFDWYYAWEETVLILEGRVRVTSAQGRSYVLEAGDIGHFPADSRWFWEVDHYVRKVAFCRKEVPPGLRLATRVLSRLTACNRPAALGWCGGALLRRCWSGLRGSSAATMLLMAVPM